MSAAADEETRRAFFFEILSRAKGKYLDLTPGQTRKLENLCNDSVMTAWVSASTSMSEDEKDAVVRKVTDDMMAEWDGDAELVLNRGVGSAGQQSSSGSSPKPVAGEGSASASASADKKLYVALFVAAQVVLYVFWGVCVRFREQNTKVFCCSLFFALSACAGALTSIYMFVLTDVCTHKNATDYELKKGNWPVIAIGCTYFAIFLAYKGTALKMPEYNYLLRFIHKMFFERLFGSLLYSAESTPMYKRFGGLGHVWGLFFFSVPMFLLTYGTFNYYVWFRMNKSDDVASGLIHLGCRQR